MKRQSLHDKMEMKKVRESERGAKEREVFVERLTRSHDLIVLLKTAGVDEREGGGRDAKPHTHCCSVGDKEEPTSTARPTGTDNKTHHKFTLNETQEWTDNAMHITSSEERQCSFPFRSDK